MDLKKTMYNALKDSYKLINFIGGKDRINIPIICYADRDDITRALLGIDMEYFVSIASESLNNDPDLKLNKYIVPYCEEDVEDGEGGEGGEGGEVCEGAVNKENKLIAYLKFTTDDYIHHEKHGLINTPNIWKARFVISTTKNND